MFDEFIGFTHSELKQIDKMRASPEESRREFIIKLVVEWARQTTPAVVHSEPEFVTLTHDVRVPVGETLYLFFSKAELSAGRAAATGEFRTGGKFYMRGKNVPPSRGSHLQAAMTQIQRERGIKNEDGELISYSAYRQWHVKRDGRYESLENLRSQPVITLTKEQAEAIGL